MTFIVAFRLFAAIISLPFNFFAVFSLCNYVGAVASLHVHVMGVGKIRYLPSWCARAN